MNYAIPSLTEHTVGDKDRFWVESSHHIDCWHLILVEKGVFSYTMLEKNEVAGEYSAVLFPVNVKFNRKVIDTMKIHHFGITFDRDDDWLKANRQFLYGKLNAGPTLVKEICNFCNQYAAAEHLPLKDNMIKALWSVALASHLKEASKEILITNEAVAKAVTYMHEHLREKISIAELAKGLGFTHVDFTRLFSKEIGKTPIAFLNEMRLNKARRLLCEADLSLKEIAEECGFENQFYLHNRFKKMFGISPSVYKKQFFLTTPD